MEEGIFESIFIDVYYGNETFTVGTIYRPPKSTIEANNKYFSFLNRILNKLNASNNQCFIMGDQNYDLSNDENPMVDQFTDEMFSKCFYPLINHPTHFTDTSATVIDHIWTNITEKNISSGILVDKIADHLPVFQITELPFFIEPSPLPSTNLNTKNLKHFNRALSFIDVSEIENISDINDAFSTLHRVITVGLNSLPKSTNLPDNNKPWYDDDLRRQKIQKEKQYRKYMRTRRERDKRLSDSAKSIYFKNVHIKRDKYYENKFFKLRNNLKGTWKVINSLLGKTRKTQINAIEIKKKVINDTKKIANNFNTYFSNVAHNIRKEIPLTIGFKNYLPRASSPSSFFLAPTNIEEITRIISKLKPKRSSGLDKIPTIVLKYLPENILGTLVKLFNRSLEEGVFPQIYKTAKVVPIYKKKGSRKHIDQYRPVSLINCMSKIIEKIVYKRVSDFLDSNTFFTNRQFGFRKHMSTSHAITLLVDSISKNMNRKNKTLGLFLDLSRAFDLIDHEILLYKLNHYGFRGISNAWFRSYLSNRTQQVEVDSLLSDNVCGIRFGTPQGSILAPLLFLIFINDLPNCLEHSEPLLFADDTNLLITHKNCHDLIRLGNLELANIQTYMNCNKLLINTDKTKAIIFHTPSTQIPNNLGNLNLSGEKIDIIKETKFLGLKIHEKLSWKTHMLDIKSTLRKNTAICSKIKNQLNPKAFVDLYHTMIECHIRYGITSWCFGNMTIKNSLQRSCNRFLKMALKCPNHLLSEK